MCSSDLATCNVARVREFLESAAGNLQVAGRNGMHKYDNQDHAMLTGLMAARNVMGGSFDLWRVNSDAEYLEDEVESAAFEIATPPMAIDEDEDRRLTGISALDPTLSVRDR